MTIPSIQGTTACFPGFSLDGALKALHQGIGEAFFGPIHTAHVQLCPQTMGTLTPARCEDLREQYPDTQFRLHANARVLERHVLYDASCVNATTWPYFQALADRSTRLGATAYSLHAGYRNTATLEQLADAMHRLADLFGFPVAVEGLYARTDRPQLIDSWQEYHWLLDQDFPYAIDLSHLQIVAARERGWRPDLVKRLLGSPRCAEVHVSDNNGRADQHRTVDDCPSWAPYLADIHPNAVVFTEGNQLAKPESVSA